MRGSIIRAGIASGKQLVAEVIILGALDKVWLRRAPAIVMASSACRCVALRMLSVAFEQEATHLCFQEGAVLGVARRKPVFID